MHVHTEPCQDQTRNVRTGENNKQKPTEDTINISSDSSSSSSSSSSSLSSSSTNLDSNFDNKKDNEEERDGLANKKQRSVDDSVMDTEITSLDKEETHQGNNDMTEGGIFDDNKEASDEEMDKDIIMEEVDATLNDKQPEMETS